MYCHMHIIFSLKGNIYFKTNCFWNKYLQKLPLPTAFHPSHFYFQSPLSEQCSPDNKLICWHNPVIKTVITNELPKPVSACFSSCLSIIPELSLSYVRKTFCQSVMYFQTPVNSLKFTPPLFSLSNMPETESRNPCKTLALLTLSKSCYYFKKEAWLLWGVLKTGKKWLKYKWYLGKFCQKKQSHPLKEEVMKQNKRTRVNHRVFIFPGFSFPVQQYLGLGL